ncbi:hypothetical protein JX265_008874 [Neoarthrinium moseri]|uniref:Uncharacterized protein n=1 Tax=Neoarthrinium moseri TaxID=1658444 RepID=A0A9Q0AJX5_9PEZI|nr:uncharacterized protein JN550_009590 [Neoarthrinium moseri]KAI1848346.1 hypothetical protein JX266_005652 [Neoarthrinium moseri]KAI1863479.1 hypothetical protein JN550_009590 [Neoarthrinium moseri]KAI1863657.1 hypothetical protein JX265_008874 [Neoarthrinium moseri]
MFGGLVNLLQPSTIGPPPKDVPPATPVVFPDCHLPSSENPSHETPVVRLLQSLHRPGDLSEAHFGALGLQVHAETPAQRLLPDPSFLPPTSKEWENISLDEARARDSEFQIPLSNGNKSPEARVYLERRNELSIDNQSAFRTVRRMRPEPGVKSPRLGNCYEFFRQLEQMANHWDDTSLPTVVHSEDEDLAEGEAGHVKKSRPNPLDASLEQAELANLGAAAATATESNSRAEPKGKENWRVTYRTAPGNTMPPEVRHNLISAFIKLVSYDFGCNIAAPRVEPRLYLQEPAQPDIKVSSSRPPRDPTVSYFPSGCVFLGRTPRAREAARAGVVEGPLAAVSARNTTSFSTQIESAIDLGRELVAALITAQLRAREGREEKRAGEGKWWATAKRWGGSEGGPIGREIEGAAGVTGDKDKNPVESRNGHASTNDEKPDSPTVGRQSSLSQGNRPNSPPKPISPSSGLPMRGPPAAKKPRKGHSIYDNYRQVRPPISNWDIKARYQAIGKTKNAQYDDIFVISSIFHHVSILRVRVPDRLLDVFAGAEDVQEGSRSGRSWEKLEVWRSRWFDLFLPEERLEALRVLWGANAWMMRTVDDGDGKKDIAMKGS